ncbi:MAG: zinc-ribbon domain-containing protein [Nitrososphaerota archaeon]|nr:zinc-ribbon domain-containing protein [Nitrososphaerota archaeon]
MYCMKCGAQVPDDAEFCMKCGAPMKGQEQATQTSSTTSTRVIAAQGATSLKCPNCGAPITPKFGEMVITCEYCGSGITLGTEGWTGISKQSMLPLKIATEDDVLARTHKMLDHGLLHRHLQETSTVEEASLSIVPYWMISVSARTSIVAIDAAAEVGTVATTAALFGAMAAGMGNQRGGGFGGGLFEGAVLGSVMGGGMGGGGGVKKTYELDENYNYPVVALKALTEYQPRDFQFALDERTLFDVNKIPKGLKILNGDVSEEAAKYQAKTLVDQLQSQKAHSQHHMIQQIHTDEDVADGELLYVPVWFVRFDHKGKKIILVVDGNSGNPINSIGL